jgi:para-nitrobenzyl esterase
MHRVDRVDAVRRRLLAAGAAGTALACMPAISRARGAPVVRTTAGRVRGRFDGDLQIFRGIRYGADTAARRFQAPEPPAPWRDVRDALAFGAASPQRGSEPDQSEDCLFLNVVAPRAPAAPPRPVLV